MKSYNLKKITDYLDQLLQVPQHEWSRSGRNAAEAVGETLRNVGRWGRRSGGVLARSGGGDISGGRRQDWQGRGHGPGSSGLSDLACEEEQDDQLGQLRVQPRSDTDLTPDRDVRQSPRQWARYACRHHLMSTSVYWPAIEIKTCAVKTLHWWMKYFSVRSEYKKQ